MKIQSLSISVPAGCQNNCKFCVSRLHPSPYPNLMEKEIEFRDLHERDFTDCMQFARDNGCNTLMFTGDGEPLLNKEYMQYVTNVNNSLDHPFRWIELQTSGYKLQEVIDGRNKLLRWLRNSIRVKVISLSLSDVFSDYNNAYFNGTPEKNTIRIEDTCSEIKRFGFTLRLSLNMTRAYDDKSPYDIFTRARKLGAEQITFRKLYTSPHILTEDAKEINNWILTNSCSEDKFTEIREYVMSRGVSLERLPFGAMKYSVKGISTVVDDDCMSQNTKEEVKYLILRPNCKLYTKWDDEGSVLF